MRAVTAALIAAALLTGCTDTIGTARPTPSPQAPPTPPGGR